MSQQCTFPSQLCGNGSHTNTRAHTHPCVILPCARGWNRALAAGPALSESLLHQWGRSWGGTRTTIRCAGNRLHWSRKGEWEVFPMSSVHWVTSSSSHQHCTDPPLLLPLPLQTRDGADRGGRNTTVLDSSSQVRVSPQLIMYMYLCVEKVPRSILLAPAVLRGPGF